MALIFTKATRGGVRTPAPQNAGDIIGTRVEHTLTTAQNVTGNIIDFAILPAWATVFDMILDADDLDSGSPAITLDVGLMTGSPGEALDAAGAARTCGAEFFAASTVAQAGTIARPTLKTAFRVAPVAYDRSIGVKVLLQAATAVEGAIGLSVAVRS